MPHLRLNFERNEGYHRLKDDFEEQGKKAWVKTWCYYEPNRRITPSQKLDSASAKSLESLLKPFKENLDAFKKSVENSQESSIKKFAELSKEIELVARAGINISKEAENLAKALKGKNKPKEVGERWF